MLICDRCRTSIPDGARFCATCGDPVTAADDPENQDGPGSETVQLVCPHCESQSLFTIPSNGVGELACPACAGAFGTTVVRIRSKRSAGQKASNTRTFSVRVERLDGREDFVEFIRPKNEDFELRSRDHAAFSTIQGKLVLVQNMSVGGSMTLVRKRVPAEQPRVHVERGCAGAIVVWVGAVVTAGALLF